MASVEELQEELVRQSTRRLLVEHELMRNEESLRGLSKESLVLKDENATLKTENTALTQRIEDMENELADLSSSLLEQANQQVAEANKKAASVQKRCEERDLVIQAQAVELQALKEMLERNEDERQRSIKAAGARKIARVASYGSSSPVLPAVSSPSEESIVQSAAHLISPRITGSEAGGSSSTAGALRGSPAASTPSTPNLGSLPQPQQQQLSSSVTNSPSVSEKLNENEYLQAPSIPVQLTRSLILVLDAYASPLRPIIRTDLRDFKDFMALWGVERSTHSSMFSKLEAPPWRRSRFVQRVIQEDVEPTLRLDRSPHMSWLSSRAYFNSIMEQKLEIRPVSAKERPWAERPSHPCLLCGENRSGELYARLFWAIPSPDHEPIVLCPTCALKTRLVCELVAMLRSIAFKAPAKDDTELVRTWRQCNTLREQVFWARVGGLYPDGADALALSQKSGGDDFEFNFEEAYHSSIQPSSENIKSTATVKENKTESGPLKESASGLQAEAAPLSSPHPGDDPHPSDPYPSDRPQPTPTAGNNDDELRTVRKEGSSEATEPQSIPESEVDEFQDAEELSPRQTPIEPLTQSDKEPEIEQALSNLAVSPTVDQDVSPETEEASVPEQKREGRPLSAGIPGGWPA